MANANNNNIVPYSPKSNGKNGEDNNNSFNRQQKRPGLVLTPDLQDRLCNLIAAGNYPETAATIVGIHARDYYRWMNAGREEISEANDDGPGRVTDARESSGTWR